MAYTFGQQPKRTMDAGGADMRYRIKILLIAEKRPRYWEFHCVRCGQKVCELSGDVAALLDSADITVIADYHHAPIAFQCKGKFCRMWYEFDNLS